MVWNFFSSVPFYYSRTSPFYYSCTARSRFGLLPPLRVSGLPSSSQDGGPRAVLPLRDGLPVFCLVDWPTDALERHTKEDGTLFYLCAKVAHDGSRLSSRAFAAARSPTRARHPLGRCVLLHLIALGRRFDTQACGSACFLLVDDDRPSGPLTRRWASST